MASSIYRVLFSGGDIVAEVIYSEKYVNDYISFDCDILQKYLFLKNIKVEEDDEFIMKHKVKLSSKKRTQEILDLIELIYKKVIYRTTFPERRSLSKQDFLNFFE